MNYSIPKIIHQIWIGPKEEPTQWTNTFKIDYINAYPDYKYILWNESNLDNLFKDFLVLKIVYDLEETWNGKSDILRYLILFYHGGIYIDADCVWLNNKNFDELINNSTGFFGAREPNTTHLVGTVIGSYKNNQVFLKIIKHIESIILNSEGKVIKHRYVNKRKVMGVCKLIGPIIFDHFAKNENITVFPSHYFYPIGWHSISDKNYHLNNKMPEDSYMFHAGYSTNFA